MPGIQNTTRTIPIEVVSSGWATSFPKSRLAAYLNQDYASAKAHQAAQPGDIAAAVRDAHAKLAAEANPPPPPLRQRTQALRLPAAGGLAPQTFSNVSVTITPLLTPDKLPDNAKQGQYLANITKVIDGAEHALYIQLQYMEASSGNGDSYDNLLKAIAARIADDVDVRVIVSADYAEKWGEKMKAQGVDLTANIRTQPNVHNKGFVVDSQTAVVSSQNFSPAGVEENRDAGVIIEHAGIAQYFEKVFVSDWNGAKPFVAHAAGRQPGGRSTRGRAGARKTIARKAVAKRTPRKRPAVSAKRARKKKAS